MNKGNDAYFTSRYPISIFAVLVGVISFHEKHGAPLKQEPPLTKAMRDLAEYAGFTYGHLRTILSIWKREDLLVAKGEHRSMRWLFGPKLQTVRSNLEPVSGEEGVFTCAVYTFTQRERKLRETAQEILKHFRFRMFAPNFYVTWRADIENIGRSLAGFGLEDHVFLFETSFSGKPHAIKRLQRLWDVKEFIMVVRDFAARLHSYLKPPATDKDAFLRHQFAAASFYENILIKAPALPVSFFPSGHSLEPLRSILEGYEVAHRDSMIRYYSQVNS